MFRKLVTLALTAFSVVNASVVPNEADLTKAHASNQERYYNGGGGCVMYSVRPGDYCYKIATTNGISYQQFLRQNPGIDCTNLAINQNICLLPLTIPGWSGFNKGLPVSCKTYEVQAGDMCAAIAEQSSISVDRLIELNSNMAGWNGCQELYVGQALCVE